MAKVPVRKIQIAGGQTFTDTVVWCEGPYVFKAISAVTLGWPTTITATAHGVPAGVTIPIWIQNAKGPSINTTDDPMRDDWQYAPYFSRSAAGIEAARVALGLSNEQVDALFVAASTIVT